MRTVITSFLAVWGCLAAVAAGQITPFLVENSGGSQRNPDVSGNVVVWMEIRDGDFIVRGKDIAAGRTFIFDGPEVGEMDPVTNGSLVVWRDDRNGNFDLYGMDIQTGQQRTLVDEPHSQTQQALGENHVVWTDGRHSPSNVPPEFGNHDIYALDLRTGQEFPVCTASHDQDGPDVSGNIIVWSDSRRYNPFLLNPWVSDIYGYDVATGKEFLIAADPEGVPQYSPAVSGNTVVWVDGHYGGDIWGHDLSTGETFPIHVETPDEYTGQNDPAIDGRYVVWEDWRNGTDTDIWGYDLLTGEEFPIFQGPGSQGDPKISGNLVVWERYIPGEPARIWAAYIPEPTSVTLLALGGALLAGRRRRRRTG